MREIEIIQHDGVDGLQLFFDTVDYRTPHIHQALELLWVVEGGMDFNCGAQRHRVGPGALLLITGGQTHEMQKTGEGCTFLCLQLSPELLAPGFPAIRNLRFDTPLLRPLLPAGVYDALVRGLIEMTRQYLTRPEGFGLFCTGRAQLLLRELLLYCPHTILTSEASAEAERRSERLMRLIDFVEHNYTGKLRLTDFAEAEGCSMSYLSHFVKEALGMSFQQYVNTVRFDSACRMIAAGERKMTDVCLASGFSDYRYFSLAFRSRVGMTPEAYSRLSAPPVAERANLSHLSRSQERIWPREESLALLQKLEKKTP